MISSFDLSKLKLLLKDFHHMTRIRITVFDDAFHELAACPELPSPFCQMIRSDKEAAACKKLPAVTADYISSASHIMQAVASFLCMERMVTLRRQELPVQIDEYIQTHFTEKLDAAALARQFGIGRTQLYKIAKQNYGVGIAEHIRNLRMEKARKLLTEQSGLTLAQIASECGFDDYNYFITVFKRVTGMPPKAYAHSMGSPKKE